VRGIQNLVGQGERYGLATGEYASRRLASLQRRNLRVAPAIAACWTIGWRTRP
jgi:hypothetical protein